MDASATPHGPRRQLKSRDTKWARTLARKACASGVTPNGISMLSVVFAALAMLCFLNTDMDNRVEATVALLCAAACIQCRLICNLLDGMVAVEGGKASVTGPIFNEAPDRLADVLILVGAGYCSNGEPSVIKLFGVLPLGWSCAVLAVGTAYLRLLQGTLTGEQSFMGPMAKQHRMAVLTIGTLLAIGEIWVFGGKESQCLKLALTVIFIGAIITCWRRLDLIVRQLKANQGRETK